MTSVAANGREGGDADVWIDLQSGLRDVFDRNPMTPKRYMELYSHVFNFCTVSSSGAAPRPGGSIAARGRRSNAQGNINGNMATDFMGIELYNKLKDFIEQYVCKILERGDKMTGEELLQFYNKEWEEYRFSAKVVDGIFSYLNRHWIKREMDEGNEAIYIIYVLCLVVWRDALFRRLNDQMTDAALELIKVERDGYKISHGLIKGLIESYVELGIDDQAESSDENSKRFDVYKERFENKFLRSTEEYYEVEASIFMANNPLTEYMKKVESRLNEEQQRCQFYIHRVTEPKLLKQVEKVLIQSRLSAFQSQFGTLLENRMDDDLARMYKLCERVDEGLANLRIALEQHITKEGLGAIDRVGDTANMDPKLYINTLLEVHRRYATLVDQAFKNESGFIQALDKAATTFINRNSITTKGDQVSINKSPEMLAKYCDQLLRKTNKAMDDNALEQTLCQVMIIFKYIEDKDIFSKYYTKMFSKRLILETSASEEAETSLIGKLKSSCGFEYTNRMSKMISDVQISKGLTSDFRQNMDSRRIKLPDLSIMILSTGSWPAMPVSNFQLPGKLGQCIDHFKKFYDEKHSGRKLTWVLSQSRGELSCSGFKDKKIFIATTAQMAILMLYNDSLRYTAGAIADGLQMDKKMVAQTVASLVKAKVLTGIEPDEKGEYDDATEFGLNVGFTNPKVKVDLSKAVMRVDPRQESQEVTRNVDEDRKSVINACIVRIMKMRKSLSHQLLLAEVLQQLSTRFKPKVELVKRCIGQLIEKEYIKRSEEQRDIYEYIA